MLDIFGILNLLAPKADIIFLHTTESFTQYFTVCIQCIIQLSWQAILADCIGN